ncbi:hypothetical protein A2384_05425 [Candidatus Peribacteria bacterium RIFOXYB1_FULL_54_35]|nr:MAG: hypothetical protein A2384_05425 [Candidatus Peribacteria bacterium RIFOXYB1_FULL_54_35]
MNWITAATHLIGLAFAVELAIVMKIAVIQKYNSSLILGQVAIETRNKKVLRDAFAAVEEQYANARCEDIAFAIAIQATHNDRCSRES